MDVRSGFIDSIGNTPLIKLIAASEATGCNIYGKAEFLNPGGSVKDRAALAIIEDAEKRGQLRPGGVSAFEHFAPQDGALASLIESMAEEIATDAKVALERHLVLDEFDYFIGQRARRHGKTPDAKRAAPG